MEPFSFAGGRGTERTVVMDKSKGEPVISVKTKSKDGRVRRTSHVHCALLLI